MRVWLKHAGAVDEVYVLGELVGEADGSEVTVKLSDKRQISVHNSDIFTANPDGLTQPDNTMLIHLSEATLLANMNYRFAAKEIYTLTGTILLAMNPFELLPIYSEEKMAPYKGKRLGSEPPHVYGTAEMAYQRLSKTKQSQSIVVSGESGAGKTETNKHLMKYLAWRSKTGGGAASLAEKILQSNPVLEAFGNAKTSRNNNSSRFGKFVKVLMDDKGLISGAKMATYLLEKSRLVTIAEGERNYHALYHLASGAPSAQVSALGLSGGAQSFCYLNQSSVLSLSIFPDEAMFKELAEALTTCGVDDSQQTHLFSCLAGILHLGNIKFDGDEEANIVGDVAMLKKTFDAELSTCLTSRSMVVAGEKTVVPLPPEKAAHARDAVAKAIYVRIFDWIVGAVNHTLQISKGSELPRFVGLLDVFGFEFFGTKNSFEQLAINFANEKLQQFFLKFVFQSEHDEYNSEGVRYTPIEFQDNQGCIDLIEKTPSGILRILDTQCKTPKANDDTFSLQVNQTHRKHDFFLLPRAAGAATKKFKEEEAFVVRHFAGNVCYMSAGFMDKNNDTLHADFEAALGASSNKLLASLFMAVDQGSCKKRGASFNSVGRRFINDLDQLMTDLGATFAHFVRCIKPNLKLQAQLVSPQLVLSQLRCSGTLEAVQLISASYPTRIPYDDIHGRYKDHMPDFVRKLEPNLFTEAIALACEVDETDFQLGRTKIFLRPGKGQFLEELKNRDLSEVIPLLVAKIKEWEMKRAARAKLTRAVGGWVHRMQFKKLRNAANAIAHAQRGRKLRAQYEEAKEDRRKARAEALRRAAEEKARKAREEEEARIAAAANVEERTRLEAEAAEAEKARAAEMEKAKADAAQKDKDAKDAAAKQKEEAKKAATERAAARAAERAASGGSPSGKPKSSAALLMASTGARTGGKDKRGGVARQAGPPARVREDTYFVATIQRSGGGLGIELDQVDGLAVIGNVVPRGAAATQTAIRAADVVTKVFEFDTPTYDTALASIRGATGGTLEMTMLRRPVKTKHRAEIEMHLGSGPKSAWRGATIEVISNREVKYDTSKYAGASASGYIAMREAAEVQLRDAPGGSCTMSVLTPKQTYELRAKDGAVLHKLYRKVTPLFPQLGLSIRREGWLSKKAETGGSWSKRWCVLDSASKMHYFKDPDAQKEQGVVDLTVATGVADTSNGLGFEVATPGRKWCFKAEDKTIQAEWMASVTAVLNDLREHKKEQEASGGASTLKAAEAAMCDDVSNYEWRERMWWELNSTGELRVLDGEGGSVATLVRLENVCKVDRPKGEDFYTFCINIDVEPPGEEEYTLTMRPTGRHEMHSWLTILKEQMKKHEKKSGGGGAGVLSLIQQGWMGLKRQDILGGAVSATNDVGRRYFVLATEQKELAGAMLVTNTLYWFETQDAASDLGSGSAIDLEEVEAIASPGGAASSSLSARLSGAFSPRGSRRGSASDAEIAIVLKITDSSWQLELTSEEGTSGAASWTAALKGHCVNAEGYEENSSGGLVNPKASAKDGGVGGSNAMMQERLRMAVPLGGAVAEWRLYDCELLSSGTLKFAQSREELKSVPAAWASGTVDVSRAIGVWLLGVVQPTLDVILPGRKFTFGATTDGEVGNPSKVTLERWHRAVLDMMPYKPVQELHKGWLEKKGDVGNHAWKMRFFVLSSTRKLLYYETESSGKPRGTIELQSASAVRPIPDEFYNYEDAIEIITGKRRWILCPSSKKEQQAWLEALLPMIGGEGATEGNGGTASMTRAATGRPSVSCGAHRARGLTLVQSGAGGMRGWLERQEEEGGEWSKRFFVLERRTRDGASEASMEYYLGETLEEDADAETITIGKLTSVKPAADASGARDHCVVLRSESGAVHTLAAASANELGSWVAAIEAAVSGRPFAASSHPTEAKAAQQSNLAGLASGRAYSDRSVGASTKLTEVPNVALRVHAGWLKKAGDSAFAKSHQRWFVLFKTGEVHYFDKEWSTPDDLVRVIGAKSHKGVVNLAGVRPEHVKRTKPSSTSDFAFNIITPKRKWLLTAASINDYEAWHGALIRVIG